MEMIGRVSRGSKMDQVYIPKNRAGLAIGNYVSIKPIDINISIEYAQSRKPVFYKLSNLEKIKVMIIGELLTLILANTKNVNNIIITGSFLNKGFSFNDLDILIIMEEKEGQDRLKKLIESSIGINTHIILLSNKELLEGISHDPVFEMMLSRYVSLNKIIYKKKRIINYQFLDLSLLKSKPLIDNFELLNGKEKYYLTKNMVSILFFITKKDLSDKIIDKEIEKLFGIKIERLKDNLIEKNKFVKLYQEIYNKTQNLLFTKNGSK
jgi:hypothetical protein